MNSLLLAFPMICLVWLGFLCPSVGLNSDGDWCHERRLEVKQKLAP